MSPPVGSQNTSSRRCAIPSRAPSSKRARDGARAGSGPNDEFGTLWMQRGSLMSAYSENVNDSITSTDARSFDAALLAGVEMEARERFGRRVDRDVLVNSAVGVARELLAEQPAVLDFVTELAIGRSWSGRAAL